MEKPASKLKLSHQVMSSDYAELMRIWFSYSKNDGENYGEQVTKYFKIATFLGIDPYTTDNHASGGQGGPGEAQKAQEERGLHQAWLATNRGGLDAVEILPEGGAERSGGGHISDEKKKDEIEAKENKKAKAERKKHAEWHVQQGHPRPAVPNTAAQCPACNYRFKT